MKKIAQGMISSQDLRTLKSQLHSLKPTVIIGSNGLTKAVIQEIDRALTDHELIKIRAHVDKNSDLLTIAEKICTEIKATLIHTIGHIIAIYRKNLQVEDEA